MEFRAAYDKLSGLTKTAPIKFLSELEIEQNQKLFVLIVFWGFYALKDWLGCAQLLLTG
jgi:hypothetical protein